MNQFKTYGFLLLYLLAMTRPVAPLFDYIMRYDYITEFLCMNRDLPELQCNGKCYLMEQLQKKDKEKHHLPKISMEEYPVGFVSIISLPFSKKNDALRQLDPIYLNHYQYLFTNSDLRPPGMSV